MVNAVFILTTVTKYKIHLGKVLATPPLNGLILPGVTRQSIIQLCEQWKEFRVEQRAITMADVISLEKSGRVSTLKILMNKPNNRIYVVVVRNVWFWNSLHS